MGLFVEGFPYLFSQGENMSFLPLVAVTMGDPVGIGPEILVKALSDSSVFKKCRPLVLGDPKILEHAMKTTGTKLEIREVTSLEKASFQESLLTLFSTGKLNHTPDWGRPDPLTGKAMVRYILKGIDLCLTKEADALVTGPIHKYAMNLSGYPYNGHTELLAEKTGTKDYVMMLAGDRIRVSLVTIHMALREVAAGITEEKILKTLRITHRAMKERFGFKNPKICVAALNPHAGESGMFGDEEERIIRPALEKAAREGILAEGPFPPDTLFFRVDQGAFDAVIAMYHDQGLIPFKMRHFHDGVNTTLGLPIIRTSVDHGTAYEIAGTGKADHRSLVAAITMAADHAKNRVAASLSV